MHETVSTLGISSRSVAKIGGEIANPGRQDGPLISKGREPANITCCDTTMNNSGLLWDNG